MACELVQRYDGISKGPIQSMGPNVVDQWSCTSELKASDFKEVRALDVDPNKRQMTSDIFLKLCSLLETNKAALDDRIAKIEVKLATTPIKPGKSRPLVGIGAVELAGKVEFAGMPGSPSVDTVVVRLCEEGTVYYSSFVLTIVFSIIVCLLF